MKLWKILGLVALAVVPFLFRKKKEEETRPVAGDVDNIFEEELSAQ